MNNRIQVLPIEVIVALMKADFQEGKTYELVVTGSSMSPTLKPERDSVVLMGKDKKPVKKLDLVFAKRTAVDGYMLHRVIEIKENGSYVLNGDGQEWVEEVPEENIIGIAESLVRKGKRISCSAAGYRLYVRLWRLTRPCRNALVKIKKKLTK